MNLQLRWIAALVCTATISQGAFAAQVSLPTTLDQLVAPDAFVVVNDLTLSDFSYLVSSGPMMPMAQDIAVSAKDDGLRFSAAWIDFNDDVGSQATLEFVVNSATPIGQADLFSDPSLLGGTGSASVTESFKNAGFDGVQLNVFAMVPPGNGVPLDQLDSVTFPAVTSLNVVKSISLMSTGGGAESVSIGVIDQAFVVPEPGSLALALMGVLSLGMLRRRG